VARLAPNALAPTRSLFFVFKFFQALGNSFHFAPEGFGLVLELKSSLTNVVPKTVGPLCRVEAAGPKHCPGCASA